MDEDRVIGKHVFGELYGISDTQPEKLRELLLRAAEVANMHIVDSMVYDRGTVYGALVLVEESHLAIHVFRGLSYALLDIYTCGDKSAPEEAYEFVVRELRPARYTKSYVDRSSA
jgi:S-adenosylmethionine decarboxylase